MLRLSGWIYEGGRFREGSVALEDGVLVDVSHRKARDPIASGLILPAFTNAHTHAGDAVVREELVGTLEDLVAPPRGLKHRVLARSTDEEVTTAMRGYFETMLHTGTTNFWDFRETGVQGVRQLYAATLGLPLRPLVFGRPRGLAYDRSEVAAILRASDGIGISSLLDWPSGDAAKLARDAHATGKLFALHASERVREDIDGVLDLRPDLLVHLTEAADSDLDRVSAADIPVAVCPRSNAFFGKVLDLPRMVRANLRLFLGTDNAMVNAPSMLRELEFAWKIARLRGDVKPQAILDMALRGRTGLTGREDTGLVPGAAADLLVLQVPGGRPTFGGVFRAIETDIVFVSAGGRAWVRARGEASEVYDSAPPNRRRRTRVRRRR